MTDFSAGPDNKKALGRRSLFGFGALALLAALLAAFLWHLFHTADRQRDASRWYVHTLQVLLTSEELTSALQSAMRGERGYLLTRDPAFLDPYRIGRRDAHALRVRLEGLTADNPEQRADTRRIAVAIDRFDRIIASNIALERAGRGEAALARVRSGMGERSLAAILDTLERVKARERALLVARGADSERTQRRSARAQLALALVGLGLLGAAVAAGLSSLRAHRRMFAAGQEMLRRATTDELTGLANRRAFLAALDAEVARSQRTHAPLSVALLDVDHFKRVNDLHGHAGGDGVLRLLAGIANETMRTGDLVGRIGGEEFAILMPETGRDEAQAACERLRRAVVAADFPAPDGKSLTVTVSTGVARLTSDEAGDGVLLRADAALYAAKRDGRNQVRLAA